MFIELSMELRNDVFIELSMELRNDVYIELSVELRNEVFIELSSVFQLRTWNPRHRRMTLYGITRHGNSSAPASEFTTLLLFTEEVNIPTHFLETF